MTELEKDEGKNMIAEMYEIVHKSVHDVTEEDVGNPIILRQLVEKTMETVENYGKMYGWAGLEKRRYAISVCMKMLDLDDNYKDNTILWLGVTIDTAIDAAMNKFNVGQGTIPQQRKGWLW